MAKGFKLDDDFDIEVVDGKFVFATGIKEKAQSIKNELLTLQGEDENDASRGIDLYGIILSETSSKTQRKNEIIRVVSYVDDITIESVLENRDTTTRVMKYYINITYDNTSETIEFEVS